MNMKRRIERQIIRSQYYDDVNLYRAAKIVESLNSNRITPRSNEDTVMMTIGLAALLEEAN